MEKIKRIFLPLAVVLILLPVLVSCDDDEPYYSPLVGTWGVTSESNIYHEFEFYSDGTGYYLEYNGWGHYGYPTNQTPFFWYVNYDDLQLRFRNGDVWNYEYEVRGNRLFLWDMDYVDVYPMEYQLIY